MQESDDRLEVDDLADAWDLGAADEIVDDAADSRTAAWAQASARWVRGHHRSIGLVAAVVVLAATATVGWVRAHPPTLAVPVLSVSAAHATAAIVQVPDPGSGGSQANPQLVLTITEERQSDVQITFEGLTGTGVSMPVSAPIPVEDGTSAYGLSPRVDCGAWQGSDRLLASFHLDDGRLSRDIAVPVKPGAGDVIGAAVTAACASYYQENPLRVLDVSAVLDPVEPVVHLTWTVHNDSPHAWSAGGESTGSSSVGPFLVPRDTPSGEVAASSTQSVTSSVAVQDCAHVGTDVSGYSISLSASHGADQVSADAPAEQVRGVVSLAQRACLGAPRVRDAHAALSVRTTGKPAPVTVAVTAEVATEGTWTADLESPSWWDQQPGAVPFPATRATVQAPVTVALTATYQPPACRSITLNDTMSVMLQGGGRRYPFVVPIDPSTPAAALACA